MQSILFATLLIASTTPHAREPEPASASTAPDTDAPAMHWIAAGRAAASGVGMAE